MLLGSIFMMLAALWQCVPAAYAAANGPERVIFRSGDGKTHLVGYLSILDDGERRIHCFNPVEATPGLG